MTPVKKGIVAIAPKSKLPFSPHVQVHIHVQNAHTSCYISGINLTGANIFSWGQDWSAMQRSPTSCSASDTLNLPPANEGTAEGSPGRSAILKPGSSTGTANLTVTPEVLQGHIYSWEMFSRLTPKWTHICCRLWFILHFFKESRSIPRTAQGEVPWSWGHC